MNRTPEHPLLAPEHLNSSGCILKNTSHKGRGVYASHSINRNTVIEISPVLFFSKEAYEAHGKHTVLDHYTFIWPDGRMALALGLGSLFNHSDPPNVSFSLDTSTDSIRYTTARDVDVGEELCIFYGHKLWFTPAGDQASTSLTSDTDDGWGGLSAFDEDQADVFVNPYEDGDQDEVVREEDLPFIRFKLPPEEEDAQSIRTVQAWIVDVPDSRHITTLLRWLKQAGHDAPELGHLKRIRKHKGLTSLLLCTSLDPPELPLDLNLPAPYVLLIPSSSALTLPSLALKSALWPTMYTPRRKDEPEPWTRKKLKTAWNAMKLTIDAALKAQEEGELPIAAHIPAPFEALENAISAAAASFTSSDTRNSLRHPLRHAAINAIRKLADYRALQSPILAPQSSTTNTYSETDADAARNGSNYLLTDQTFFITHEPCIMCSMALLHSRVKDVVYLYPMKQTGGCGGCACLPTLKGVNHRFGILQWKLGGKYGRFSLRDMLVDETIDA